MTTLFINTHFAQKVEREARHEQLEKYFQLSFGSNIDTEFIEISTSFLR